jgi:hypothetical protein
MSPTEFLRAARRTYAEANAATLRWVLRRPRLGAGWLDTKLNPLTLADYGPGDGLRGPGFTYGWIQGRGLESLVTHAGFFAHEDEPLAAELAAGSQELHAALADLDAGNGHVYFCYGPDVAPIYADAAGRVVPQARPADIFTYSDAFARKGLLAGASRHAPAEVPARLAALAEVIAAIEAGRLQMAENVELGEEALAAEADDMGPRMILLGAAGLLVRLGRRADAGFAERFIAHVLDRHFHPATGLLRDVPGGDVVNVGHGIEFVGFALEYLPEDADPGLLAALERVLAGSFTTAFAGPGLSLTASIATGRPTSPFCPWWSLPETVRAAALLYERRRSDAVLDIWQRASAAFFANFWRGTPPIAYQTVTTAGPVDRVPATPDLDPGYHTGLSLLAAIEAADRLTAP